jgi:hypothetical protein
MRQQAVKVEERVAWRRVEAREREKITATVPREVSFLSLR